MMTIIQATPEEIKGYIREVLAETKEKSFAPLPLETAPSTERALGGKTDFISSVSVCDMLNISPPTLRKYSKLGYFRGIKPFGAKRTYYRRSEIEKYLDDSAINVS